MEGQSDYDELLFSYFSGTLTEEEKSSLEDWKEASEENRTIFRNAEKVWQSLDLLKEMRTYNMPLALSKVHEKTEPSYNLNRKGFIYYWQRIAAVMIIPLLIGGAIYFMQKLTSKNQVVWQTVTTPPGIKSHITLPDGTLVWLNSGTNLSYPLSFSDNTRDVKLSGEAFFDVMKDEKHPFIVDLGKIDVKVTGTKFNIINYEQESQTDIILASGSVKLLGKNENSAQVLSEMEAGQMATYDKTSKKISLMQVDTKKYTSWIDGKLIFRDDPMEAVVAKLSRWYNVQIEIADPGVRDYIYTATFQDETIERILSLIKRTSPVEYTIIPGKQLNDGTFEKQKVTLRRR